MARGRASCRPPPQEQEEAGALGTTAAAGLARRARAGAHRSFIIAWTDEEGPGLTGRSPACYQAHDSAAAVGFAATAV